MSTWDYGSKGPSTWEADYEAARVGKEQSPIDIPKGGAARRSASHINSDVRVDARQVLGVVEHTGNTVMVHSPGGSTLVLEEKEFNLVQHHFHAPSEHTFGGQQHNLELHLVHAAADGSLAVVGILFSVGENANPFLAQSFDVCPLKVGEKASLSKPLSFQGLDLSGAAFRYAGSLTTPPCSEGVKWTVVEKIHEISQAQLDQYNKFVPFDSYRPVQPLNGRNIISCECTMHSS